MQQELYIPVLLYRVHRQLHVFFEALQCLLLKSKVRIVILRVICEGLVLTCRDPDNGLFEVKLICFNALPQKRWQL